jgi:hypothetical protein
MRRCEKRSREDNQVEPDMDDGRKALLMSSKTMDGVDVVGRLRKKPSRREIGMECCHWRVDMSQS